MWLTNPLTIFSQCFPLGQNYHFTQTYLFSIQSITGRQQQLLLMTFDVTKANISSEHIGQKHQINVIHWLDRTKAITSLHLSDEQQQKQWTTTATRACVSCTIWGSFQWASTVSGCQGRLDGGGLIVVPIWLHNELRARHGVTNRSMSYYTSYGKVGAKQTAALPVLFGVSDLMILSLAHCHGALWFVLFTKLL